jgi:hypothetical protein
VRLHRGSIGTCLTDKEGCKKALALDNQRQFLIGGTIGKLLEEDAAASGATILCTSIYNSSNQ